MSKHRLTPVQRLVLGQVLKNAKEGHPTTIVTGYRRTRVVLIPVPERRGFGRIEGVATSSVTLYFLRHHGFIEAVLRGDRLLDATCLGDAAQSYTSGGNCYQLTAKGREAIGA